MNNTRWTDAELELVRNDIVPPTRTIAAARCAALKYNITFTTRTKLPNYIRLSGAKVGDIVTRLNKGGMTFKEIAELFGLTVRAVEYYRKLYQLTVNKESK